MYLFSVAGLQSSLAFSLKLDSVFFFSSSSAYFHSSPLLSHSHQEAQVASVAHFVYFDVVLFISLSLSAAATWHPLCSVLSWFCWLLPPRHLSSKVSVLYFSLLSLGSFISFLNFCSDWMVASLHRGHSKALKWSGFSDPSHHLLCLSASSLSLSLWCFSPPHLWFTLILYSVGILSSLHPMSHLFFFLQEAVFYCKIPAFIWRFLSGLSRQHLIFFTSTLSLFPPSHHEGRGWRSSNLLCC